MARILSVSYDSSLLRTRELILRDLGHEVISALGFVEAMKKCQNDGPFDLFILGHSILHADKEALVSAFRTECPAPIIALHKASEPPVSGADFEIEPDPHALVKLVRQLTAGTAKAAD